jgi:hypothetical protein
MHGKSRLLALTSAALLVACVAPTIAAAEVRLSGNADQLVLEANNATMSEIIAGIQSTLHTRVVLYGSINRQFNGTYAGPLRRVLAHLLDGADYVMSPDRDQISIVLLGADVSRGTFRIAQGGSPGQPAASPSAAADELSDSRVQGWTGVPSELCSIRMSKAGPASHRNCRRACPRPSTRSRQRRRCPIRMSRAGPASHRNCRRACPRPSTQSRQRRRCPIRMSRAGPASHRNCRHARSGREPRPSQPMNLPSLRISKAGQAAPTLVHTRPSAMGRARISGRQNQLSKRRETINQACHSATQRVARGGLTFLIQSPYGSRGNARQTFLI